MNVILTKNMHINTYGFIHSPHESALFDNAFTHIKTSKNGIGLEELLKEQKKDVKKLLYAHLGRAKGERKPTPLRQLEEGMKQYFFGVNGILTDKIPRLRAEYEREKNKRKILYFTKGATELNNPLIYNSTRNNSKDQKETLLKKTHPKSKSFSKLISLFSRSNSPKQENSELSNNSSKYNTLNAINNRSKRKRLMSLPNCITNNKNILRSKSKSNCNSSKILAGVSNNENSTPTTLKSNFSTNHIQSLPQPLFRNYFQNSKTLRSLHISRTYSIPNTNSTTTIDSGRSSFLNNPPSQTFLLQQGLNQTYKTIKLKQHLHSLELSRKNLEKKIIKLSNNKRLTRIRNQIKQELDDIDNKTSNLQDKSLNSKEHYTDIQNMNDIISGLQSKKKTFESSLGKKGGKEKSHIKKKKCPLPRPPISSWKLNMIKKVNDDYQ